MTHGHEAENVMRMWFEWMNEHKDSRKKTATDESKADLFSIFFFSFLTECHHHVEKDAGSWRIFIEERR